MPLNKLQIPPHYDAVYNIRETQRAIKLIKQHFQYELAKALHLERISAPLFVTPESGLNDDLNGVERPVTFDILDLHSDVQIVHSLAKWKRFALAQYGFKPGSGLYTDMNAIRRDEELDNLHSVYVDQWDWELVIDRFERNDEKLREIVSKIWNVIWQTEAYICSEFPRYKPYLPEKLCFITTQELYDRFPTLTPKQRENAIAKERKAVFLMRIGDKLKNGERHDGRAPDYDDWSLNGDIIVYNKVLDCAVELSSMGIRVDEHALAEQLKKAHAEERSALKFHRMLLDGELPLTCGGGIGQSRLCMQLLQKAHIGEVQASVWPADMVEACREHGILLL